jgi:hypothetical protein
VILGRDTSGFHDGTLSPNDRDHDFRHLTLVSYSSPTCWDSGWYAEPQSQDGDLQTLALVNEGRMSTFRISEAFTDPTSIEQDASLTQTDDAPDGAGMASSIELARAFARTELHPLDKAALGFAGAAMAGVDRAGVGMMSNAVKFAGVDYSLIGGTASAAAKAVGLDIGAIGMISNAVKVAGVDHAAIDMVSKAAMAAVDRAGIGMMSNAVKVAGVDRPAIDMVSKAAMAGMDRAGIGMVHDAVKFAGVDYSLIGAAASAAAKAAGLDIGAIGMMSNAVKLVGLDYSLGSISTIGLIDVHELVEKLSVLARPGSADAVLDRERVRQLWGCYVYVQVWIICLLVLIGAMKVDATAFACLGIALSMTGVSGNSVASRARKLALDNFDRVYPPGSRMPSITNILI